MAIVRIPKYCLHAPTGQAYVRIRGRMIYLGKDGIPASREAYGRTVAEMAASPSIATIRYGYCEVKAKPMNSAGSTATEKTAIGVWQSNCM